ncbi:MAG TPA: dihydroneopterin aldolase [Casimicrobiaceae bacterium]
MAHRPNDEVMLFLESFTTSARIGIYPEERKREQRVRIDIAIRVQGCASPYSRHNVLDYNHLRDGARSIIGAGHIEYQETLCERIVAMCLSLPRVAFARVRVAKLDAFADCGAVGCEIERSRPTHAQAYATDARRPGKRAERSGAQAPGRRGQGNGERPR